MDNKIKAKFDSYPLAAQQGLSEIRQLIFQIAESEMLGRVTEDLKWGQLSYSCRHGSPVRIDWNESNPDHASIFFHCQTKLVATFRELYSTEFSFNGNRELIIPLAHVSRSKPLSHCLSIALQYHQLKHLQLLGQ